MVLAATAVAAAAADLRAQMAALPAEQLAELPGQAAVRARRDRVPLGIALESQEILRAVVVVVVRLVRPVPSKKVAVRAVMVGL